MEADQLTEEMKGRHVQAAKNFGKANLASIFQNDQKRNLLQLSLRDLQIPLVAKVLNAVDPPEKH